MSSNLLKANWFVCNPEDARVIDSNKLIAEKLDKIAKTMQEKSGQNNEGFGMAFSEGLDIQRVTSLVGEGEMTEEGETVSNIIKATPVYNGPSPEELIEKAQIEIEEMKAQAREDAIREAQTEVDRMKRDAYEEGKNSGYDAGYQEAIQSVQQKEQQLQKREIELQTEYENLMQELEPMFIEKLSHIYEQIFGLAVKDYQEIVVYLLSNALQNIGGVRDFIVHISKSEYPYVMEQKAKILTYVGSGNSTVEIVEDMVLKEGECYIETGSGIFDCSLGVQLEELGKELRLLSYEA